MDFVPGFPVLHCLPEFAFQDLSRYQCSHGTLFIPPLPSLSSCLISSCLFPHLVMIVWLAKTIDLLYFYWTHIWHSIKEDWVDSISIRKKKIDMTISTHRIWCHPNISLLHWWCISHGLWENLEGKSIILEGKYISPLLYLLDLFKVKLLSLVQLFATPWTVGYHAPLSMGFSRQEYWSGLPFPSLEDLPNPRIEPGYPRL